MSARTKNSALLDMPNILSKTEFKTKWLGKEKVPREIKQQFFGLRENLIESFDEENIRAFYSKNKP